MSEKKIQDFDRAKPLDTGARKQLEKLLPDGCELVEGDFADDEKWRIVHPEQITPEPGAAQPDEPVEIGSCEKCGGPVHEHEKRVEDHRGLWHGDHYQAAPDTAAETKKAHARLRKIYDGDAATLKILGLTR